jgi:hypothetical protein
MQNVESGVETINVHPPQVRACDLAIGKIAKVAAGIAGIGNSDVTDGWATTGDQLQHVPKFRSCASHASRLDALRTSCDNVSKHGAAL